MGKYGQAQSIPPPHQGRMFSVVKNSAKKNFFCEGQNKGLGQRVDYSAAGPNSRQLPPSIGFNSKFVFATLAMFACNCVTAT